MSFLAEILISASPSAPMESVANARAVPGRGLEGDRYFEGKGTFSPSPQKPDFEVTLIAREAIESFVRNSGLPFTSSLARRNLVTTGIDLNACVGKTLLIGSVRIRAIRLCEPCNYLAKTTHPDVLKGLVHRGGLRAQILTEGILSVGASILVESGEPAEAPAT